MKPPDPFEDELSLDEHPLAGLADAILDGTPTDWTSVTPGDTYDEELAHQLRVLAGVVALHRTPAAEEPATPSSSPIGSWGHLQLLEKVGQGAFGDVYRAWDPRLSREVAVKLLSGPTATDADQRNWVIHEARCLAAVRHPNVITVHGADRVDGRVGFWTEFIHGQTLAAMVQEHGPFGAAAAMAIGIDLCRAVEAVHQAGLLHRDIKATNVMQEENGRIVLLDFGTSRNSAEGLDAPSRSANPTGATGTPLYLAPELWHGGVATPQSDLYSVGVVLYYLVTGTYPVRGLTIGELSEAHRAGRRSPLTSERPDLSGPFVAVLERALNADPAQRFESASAFEAALSQAQAEDAAAARSNHWGPIVLVVGVIMAIGIIVAIVLVTAWPRTAVTPPTARLVLTPNGQLGHPSRDGRFYPWVESGSGDVKIWEIATGRSHTVAQHTSNSSGAGWERQVPSDDPASANYNYSPTAMSPNGDRVVYTWATGEDTFELRLVNADGTLDRTLLEPRSAFEPYPVEWSADGTQILCWLLNKDGTADLVLVAAEGGSRHLLATKKMTGIPGTTLAPDGRSVIFERSSSAGPHELVRVTLDNPTPTAVFSEPGGEDAPIWVDATHLFFVRPSRRFKDSHDAYIVRGLAGQVRGEPSLVMENLGSEADYVVTGQTSVQSHTLQGWNEVYTATLDPTGRTPPSLPVRISPTEINGHMSPSWSPDGSLIGFYRLTPSQVVDIKDTPFLAVKDVATGVIRDLHAKLQLNRYRPRWLPDGKRFLVFASDNLVGDGEGRFGWYEVNVETGASKPVVLGIAPLAQFLPDFQSVIYFDVSTDDASKSRGFVWRQLASGQERVIVPEGVETVYGRPEISRDGRYMAFLAEQTVNGKVENRLDLQPLNGGPRRVLLSAIEPDRISLHSWTPDGRNLIISRAHFEAMGYRREPVWLLPVQGGPLVDMHFTVEHHAVIDMNPDGQRIVYPEPISNEMLWTRPLPLEPQNPSTQKH